MIKSGKNIRCVICNKDFYIPKHRVNSAKCCSRKCQMKYSQKRFDGICKICGNDFEYIACREGKAKYCSRKCYYKAQHLNGTIINKCKFCKKEFRSSPSHNRINCSRYCKNEGMKKSKTGNFICVRKALERRGLINKCMDCGYNSNVTILGVHHKDNNRENNSINNLIVLCPNCHSIRHNKHIPHIS